MEGGPDRRRRLARLGGPALPWSIGIVNVATALEPRNGVAQLAGAALGALLAVALAWRAERPVLVAAVVLAASVPYHLLVPTLVIPFAGLVALWSLTLARPPNVSLVGLAALVGISAMNVFTTHTGDAVFSMGLCLAVWALAESARLRVEAAQSTARRAASDEKARIARELHDVIAHSVSVIVVQAAAADDVFDQRPDQARTALQAIEKTGREALVELRRLLGAVVPGDGDGDGATGASDDHGDGRAPAAPQPGLDRLDDLADQVRAAGLDVDLGIEGEAAPLPAGIDLSAYRIVQEALTNTLRHARARTATVRVRHRAAAVEIEVVDDGRGASRSTEGAGYGIVGMRERAAVLGGTLVAGPTAHGGFRVRAVLPLDPEAAPLTPASAEPAAKPAAEAAP
jgi:signal transduction histidine kinase